jgi:hypothetical protein
MIKVLKLGLEQTFGGLAINLLALVDGYHKDDDLLL